MRTTLENFFGTRRSFLCHTIPIAVASLLAAQAWAGTLTVSGDLTTSSNLIANSITLGGVTETTWNFLPLQGSKYVIVPEGTNDIHRGYNLRAAYSNATTLSPSSSSRVAVIVPPGNYSLAPDFAMNTSYVDLIGLVPCQMTSKQVFTDSTGTKRTKTIANPSCPVIISGIFTQSADYVRIESVILANSGQRVSYYPTVAGSNTVLRHVSLSRTRDGTEYAGLYIDCISGNEAFGNDGGTASGTFIDCVAGDNSFGAGGSGHASGSFINCTGGDLSFGSGSASGSFVNCVGGDGSFGSASGSATGSFTDCVGGIGSFAGDGDLADGGVASGKFVNCVGGDGSFGCAANDTISGTFIDCSAGDYSFGGWDAFTLSPKFRHCKAGDDSLGGFGPSDDFNYNINFTNAQ